VKQEFMQGSFQSFFIKRIKPFFRHPRPWVRVTRWIAAGCVCILFLVSSFIFLIWIGFFGKVPGKKELENIQHPIASEVYSADSVLLGRYFLEERTPVDANEIPESLKQALIATEDARFYNHDGVDAKSLFRVLFKSILLQDEGSGGGSTLTQQLAKNLYPRKSLGFMSLPVNKIREMIIAGRLEKVYTKDEILVLYLNTIPFADNTYGIKTAADRFFSTNVKSLTIDQSAVLIGMLKATHHYNPRLFPDRALQRRNVVISQMEKYEYISAEEERTWQSKPLGLKYNDATSADGGIAPYFRAYLQRELLAWCKEHEKDDGKPYNLYTDGLKIYTTIDSRLQKYGEEALRSHMKELQKRFEGQLPKTTVEKVALSKLKQLQRYKRLIESGKSESEALAELKKPGRTKVFTWEGEKVRNMSPYDSLKHHLKFLQAGLMAIDPQSGEIKVWIGGSDHRFFKYDHVRESTKRQVGSTIKPLIYATALEEGVDPCSYVSARKTSYTNLEGWTPANTEEETYDRKYSMEGGLAGSVNTVSVKILEKTGIKNSIAMLQKMGIKSKLPSVPSLALGTPSISVREMVNAYATLANLGNHLEPTYLLGITTQDGQLLEKFGDDKKVSQALSRESALMMIHMLKSVVSEGTGSALRSRYGLTNDIVGKTGTTQANVDGWFMAAMPKLVIGAWVGADDPRLHFQSTALGQGAATALPIVAKLVQLANTDRSLNAMMNARFESLSESMADKLDCKRSKNGRNIFERIFKKKKGVKVTKFKGRKEDRGKGIGDWALGIKVSARCRWQQDCVSNHPKSINRKITEAFK
jgi:penicillin-binding protein 1A